MQSPPCPEREGNTNLEHALGYAHRGWPVLPVPAGSKAATLTGHGVKDATTDPQTIRAWWRRWADANVAIATGAPGPQVLDIDDLTVGREALEAAIAARAPDAATGKGRHLYFAGQARGTIALGYGELRGQGSYVVAPPSVHPSGRVYTWLLAPNSCALPPVPRLLTADTTTVGSGEHQPPAERVPYHQRHPYLVDFAVRLLRAGITDQDRIEAHLRLEFELSCEPLPKPEKRYFQGLAEWACGSEIADRERAAEEFADRWRTRKEPST